MASKLFTPIDISKLRLPNRIAVAPMCQYSAADGSATDWHIQHWMNLAMSGAGSVTVEATAVERRGRITHECLGLYSDENEACARRALDAAKRVAIEGTAFGVQLAHAGRKAANHAPWRGTGPLQAGEDPWPVVGPSAIAFDKGWQTPEAMDRTAIARLVEAFVAAGRRAVRAGFDYVEVHGAHGYLIQSFLSPIANRREDEYGGPIENRMRLALEVVRALRATLPARMPVGIRLSSTEWVEGGFSVEDAVAVSRALKAEGVAYVCASSGGGSPAQQIPLSPGYMVPQASRIRNEAGVVTRAVGLIETPEHAEEIIANGDADMVALARAMLADPRWPWRAAVRFGAELRLPPQYDRGRAAMERSVRGRPPAA